MKLDPAHVQILLLEMQPPILAASQTVPAANLQRTVQALRAIADPLGLPLLATVVETPQGPPSLIPELGDLQPWPRTTVSPFDDPKIQHQLKSHNRNVLALAGISSEIAILHTGLDALQAGYEVHLLTDLIGGLHPRTETAAFTRLHTAGAHPSSLSSFATSLSPDMTTPVGQTVFTALAQLWSWNP